MSTDNARALINQAQTILGQALSELNSTPDPSTAITVNNGDNIQNAIDAAVKANADVLISPGSYPTFQTRARTRGSRVINIRSNVSSIPLDVFGRPTSVPVTIIPITGSNVGINIGAGSFGYNFQGIGVLSPGVDGTMISVDHSSKSLDDVPDSISFINCLLDGGNACKRGITGNGSNIVLRDSVIKGVMKQGQDCQAFGAYNGPGPFLVQNNYLSASGENVIFGGSDPTIANLIPSNITIRANYITKDIANWRKLSGATKNIIEFKNAQDFLVELNTLEYAWVDGQSGYLMLLNVRNQNNTAPQSTVRRGVVKYNCFRHGYSAFNILGLDDVEKVKGTANLSKVMQDISINNNLCYDIGNSSLNDVSGVRVGLLLNNGPENFSFLNNTLIGSLSDALAVTLGKSGVKCKNAQIQNNILNEGNYGINGDFSTCCDSDSVFDYNYIIRGTTGRKVVYPGTHNTIVPNFATDIQTFLNTPKIPNMGVDIADLQSKIAGLDLTL